MSIATNLAPITGRENPAELEERVAALSQFYRAFNTRDIALMAENWDRSENASMDNPLGGIKRGWPEIQAVYERIFGSPASVRVEFYDYTLHVIGYVLYAVGRERGTLEAGETHLDLAIRTSRFFARIDGRFRQVHHHGSIDDPNLLAAYQQAVR